MKFLRRSNPALPAEPNYPTDLSESEHPEDFFLDHVSGLFAGWYLRIQLAQEILRVKRHQRPLSIIACMPQMLRGDDPGNFLAAAGEHVRKLLRECDLAGTYRDGAFIVILPETPEAGARVLAQRLRSELALRSPHIGIKVWLVGWASYPGQGTDPEALWASATESANASREAAA